MVKFGDIIRDMRKAKGLSQEQLASMASVTPKTIYAWETADRPLNRGDTLQAIAKALETTPELIHAYYSSQTTRSPEEIIERLMRAGTIGALGARSNILDEFYRFCTERGIQVSLASEAAMVFFMKMSPEDRENAIRQVSTQPAPEPIARVGRQVPNIAARKIPKDPPGRKVKEPHG